MVIDSAVGIRRDVKRFDPDFSILKKAIAIIKIGFAFS
jgi:hypothetical protein